MKLFKTLSTKNILRITIVVLILCGIFVFDAHFGVNVWAQTTQGGVNTVPAASTGLTGVDIIDAILQIVYMIFYPLIFLAGLAMDNSLIYGEVFHLDVPLWRFWNIIKNLANFTLGFMVLFTILKNVFSIGKKVDDVKKIVTSTLIAGVLIQASWFLTAALIDISTIATYGIGALPMSVLEGTKVGDQKILAVDSVMDIDKSFNENQNGDAFKTSFRVKYNGKDVFLSPCLLKKDSFGDTYIVGRKYYDQIYQNYNIFGENSSACVVNSKQIVIYNEFIPLNGLTGSEYEDKLTQTLSRTDAWQPWESCKYVIKINGAASEDGKCESNSDDFKRIRESYELKYPDEESEGGGDLYIENWLKAPKAGNFEVGLKGGETRFKSKEVVSTTISDLIDKSKGLVGPMMTIFSSMMNFAQISEHSQDNGVGAIGMETLIKALFALAIFFPLLALTLVLIARIGILRLVVAGSPFIVLVKIFKDQLGKSLGSLADKLDMGNILKIIFSPVIVVFALSMSIIFLQTLISGFNNTEGQNCSRQKEIGQSLMISPVYTAEQEKKNDCKTDEYVFLDGLIKIKANGTFDWSGTGDLLSRTMVNIMAIGLVRFLLFAAIKASGKLGEAVGKGVQDFGSSVMKTMPILPVPGATTERAGIGAWKEGILGSGGNNAIWNRKINQMEQDQENAVGEVLNKNKKDNTSGTSTDNTDKSKQIVEYVQKTATPGLDDLNKEKPDNEKITADYMTKTQTLTAIEAEIKKNEATTNDNINRLSLLLNDAIKMKLSSSPTKKEDLDNIFGSILSSNDAISKKFLEDFITKPENNFTVLEGTNNMKYKIEKINDKFELKGTPVTP